MFDFDDLAAVIEARVRFDLEVAVSVLVFGLRVLALAVLLWWVGSTHS